MNPLLVFAVLICIASAIGGGVCLALVFASLQAQRESTRGWQRLAEQLSGVMVDRDERLMLRSGYPQAPAEKQEAPPVINKHAQTEEEWVREDEMAEIEEKARQCLYDPEVAAAAEDAALFDPQWRAVYDRYLTLKSPTNVS